LIYSIQFIIKHIIIEMLRHIIVCITLVALVDSATVTLNRGAYDHIADKECQFSTDKRKFSVTVDISANQNISLVLYGSDCNNAIQQMNVMPHMSLYNITQYVGSFNQIFMGGYTLQFCYYAFNEGTTNATITYQIGFTCDLIPNNDDGGGNSSSDMLVPGILIVLIIVIGGMACMKRNGSRNNNDN
jgi:hypothetical protein